MQNERKETGSSMAPFTFSSYELEHHLKPIYCVQFKQTYLNSEDPANVFATSASNRVTLYECLANGHILQLRYYLDDNRDEEFYTFSWSHDAETGAAIIAAAGIGGIIRILDASTMTMLTHLSGHVAAINELKFHPKEAAVLLSASKDGTLRLWNVKTNVCIAIFGRTLERPAEILTADIRMDGTHIISGSTNRSLRVWRLNKQRIAVAIRKSHNPATTPMRTVREYHSAFLTRSVHRFYVNCVRWLGDLVLSKAGEGSIVCWSTTRFKNPYEPNSLVVYRFRDVDTDNFSLRFSLDSSNSFIALGHQQGKTFVWQLNVTFLAISRCSLLEHAECKASVRDTAFSLDGRILICVCQDATVWRWDLCS